MNDVSSHNTEPYYTKTRSDVLAASHLLGEIFLDYRITDVLGTGGMGIVYKAYQASLDRYVALKMLPSNEYSPFHIQQLKDEAKMAAKLQHPHIVSIHLFAEDKGHYFFVMDLCEGITLEKMLEVKRKDKKRRRPFFSLEESLKILQQVGSALAYAHEKNIIHRDVKTANVMMDQKKNCRVMDFGLASFYRFPTGNTAKMVAGTPAYMSPEQTLGKDLDPRTDIFSLGVILYELLTLERPFPDTSSTRLFDAIHHRIPPAPSSINPEISPDIDSMVFIMMEKKKEDRYASMNECLEDVEKVIQKKQTHAYQRVSSYHARGMKRKDVYSLRKRRSVLKNTAVMVMTGLLFLFGLAVLKVKMLDSYRMDSHAKRDFDKAKNYMLIRRYDLAEPLLQKIISDYSRTPYAEKAEGMLNENRLVE
ncbi:MAG: serine/threonine protein kinase [Candidatus Aureabacteria bacterium]|nr:serine/threonine protein kinase [Candidatus Auribacterota bacterium]